MMNAAAKAEYERLTRMIEQGFNLDRTECEQLFPNLIKHILDSTDLVSLISESGIDLKPISADRPDILVGCGCPNCGGPIYIRSGRHE